MNKILLSTALAATLAGCVVRQYTPPPPPLTRPAFPESEYLRYVGTGTNSVTGQAFLKTRGGDVKTAAGNDVYLQPVTSYSNWSYDHRFETVAPADPRIHKYLRKTVADASGRFTFKNVPDGHYYITTAVTWQAPTGYRFALETQGGVIWKAVSVKDGETADVIVTR